MVKTITLEFSDQAYRTLETMAEEVGCSPDQLMREALGWSYLIQAGIEHDPHGKMLYVGADADITLELVSEAAFSQYIQKLRTKYPQKIRADYRGKTCIQVDPCILFRPLDKK